MMVQIHHPELMQWIIEANSYNEPGHAALLAALADEQVDVVKVVPFSHTLEPEPVVTEPVMVMGSTTLVDIARTRGWFPGAFTGAYLDSCNWPELLGSHWLNRDARWCRLDQLKFDGPRFVRPRLGLKTFPGQVFHSEELTYLREYMYDRMGPDSDSMEVFTAVPKRIFAEYRMFVVGGWVVAQSLYRFRGDLVMDQYVPEKVSLFATLIAAQIEKHFPDADAYALDIAKISDPKPGEDSETAGAIFPDYRVIELNCLNASGFYAADVKRIVGALKGLEITSPRRRNRDATHP